MALKPEDRYATPRLLAEDIERWMADEPVSACREPWTRTLARWLSRHRTGVTAVAAAILVALVGTAAVLAVQSAANAQLSASLHRESRANTALATANVELTRSRAAVQARYDLAVEAIKTFHTGVSEDFLLKEEQFKDLRDRLLEVGERFLRKLGALLGKETDLASRRALLQAELRGGRPDEHGRSQGGGAGGASPGAGGSGGAGGRPAGRRGDKGRRRTQPDSHRDRCWRGSARPTKRWRRTARPTACWPPPRARPRPRRCGPPWPTAGPGLAISSTPRVTPNDGLLVLRQAQTDQEVLAEADGAAKEARRDLASTINRIGNLLLRTGRPPEAEVQYRRAMAIYQKLADDNPAVTEFRLRLAFTHNNLGSLLQITGKLSESEAEFRHAMTLRQKLADDNPAVTRIPTTAWGWAIETSAKCCGIGAGRRRRRPSTAKRSRSIRSWPTTTSPSPNSASGWRTATPRSPCCCIKRAGGAESEAEFREAMAVRQKLANDDPTLTEIQSDLAQSHHNLGYLLSDTGQPAKAEAEYRKSLVIYQKLARRQPSASPGSETAWRMATSTLASCCHRRASRWRQRPSNARRSRSTRSSTTTTPRSPTIGMASPVPFTISAT